MNNSIPAQVNAAPGGAPADDAGLSLTNPTACFAGGTHGMAITDLQNKLLARLEARLTGEVIGLINALSQFGNRAELIRAELPGNAEFCKSVTGLLALVGFQFANALGQGLNKPIFFDDGALYLRQLGLGLDDLIREVDLDGRRFLCVALIDQSASKASDMGQHAGDGKGF